jgi:hypothetical protein
MKNSLSFFLLIFVGISACKKDIPIASEFPATIQRVLIQDTMNINIRYNLEIYFTKEAPCARIKEGIWKEAPGEVTYRLILQDDGIPCAFSPEEDMLLENYQPQQLGQIQFRFYQEEGEYLTKNVLVREQN